MYYCYDCEMRCSTLPVDECHPSEAWGQVAHITETYLMCGLCGGYNIEEELFNDEENTI